MKRLVLKWKQIKNKRTKMNSAKIKQMYCMSDMFVVLAAHATPFKMEIT